MTEVEETRDWATDDDEENETPPTEEYEGPDGMTTKVYRNEDGTKTVVSYSASSNGYLQKTTTNIKLEKVVHRVPKRVAMRRKWSRFGDCEGLGSGLERGISDVSPEQINMDWIQQKDDEDGEPEDPMEAARKAASKELKFMRMQQRIKDRKEMNGSGDESARPQNWAQRMAERAAAANGIEPAGTTSRAATTKWAPPSLVNRLGSASALEAASQYQRDDSATVRVSNVSANTTESDLQDLFRRFGAIKRIYLSRDRVTGESKGFAYVAFHNISDAQECIDKLNGFPYDHLILQIEWAKPSDQRTPQTNQLSGYTRA
eukprot:Plantae.Rhodophyta-Purpureofilum_apyrenoidigerum.ctg25387.p1 GENE.Plantae.Rhodophyta-Purpureofilum_apyrenoidigerum.ctg25387~~Plantae.Rhodophyta-Purpureofilum_apyrenoidigerum.ctg25387.p1  ORF type:complete len:317 (-),score=65.03 Plantae.Rhodophyta-Purpureofilum_apyrenoidigerum.ctg25387:222-1172(-)